MTQNLMIRQVGYYDATKPQSRRIWSTCSKIRDLKKT